MGADDVMAKLEALRTPCVGALAYDRESAGGGVIELLVGVVLVAKTGADADRSDDGRDRDAAAASCCCCR